jgi:hypothetical protein
MLSCTSVVARNFENMGNNIFKDQQDCPMEMPYFPSSLIRAHAWFKIGVNVFHLLGSEMMRY